MKHLLDIQCIVHQLLVSILSSQGIHVTDGVVAELASSQAAILLTCRLIACKKLQLVPLPLNRETCKSSPKLFSGSCHVIRMDLIWYDTL